jgi:hypothetical protein
MSEVAGGRGRQIADQRVRVGCSGTTVSTCAARPPVRLFSVRAKVRQRVRRLYPLSPGRTAELPEIGGCSFVAMNEVIKVKLVDLAAVELREALTYTVEQRAKLFLMIGRHQLPRCTTRCLLV